MTRDGFPVPWTDRKIVAEIMHTIAESAYRCRRFGAFLQESTCSPLPEDGQELLIRAGFAVAR